jgi:hypothetical protein
MNNKLFSHSRCVSGSEDYNAEGGSDVNAVKAAAVMIIN